MAHSRPRRGGRRRRRALWAALALTALTAPPAQAQEPYADAREAMPAAAPRVDQAAWQQRLGTQGVVDIDHLSVTPRVLARLDGALTGPSSADPEDIATTFVRANLADLGLTQ